MKDQLYFSKFQYEVLINKKVLICDDYKDISEVTKIILSESGYEVKNVYNCDNIVNDVEEFLPDVVLMDLRVPKKGGEYATKLLKSNEKTKLIPVLIFSANHQAVKIAEEVGADGFVSKPFDIDILTALIEHHINK